MAGEKFKLHELDLSGTKIIQTEDNAGLEYEFDEQMQMSAASALPTFVFSNVTSHKIPFVTQHIKTVLDECAGSGDEGILSGYDSADVGVTDQILSFRKGKNRGVRTPLATGEHITQRVTKSLLTWESINAPQQGNATINSRLMLLSALVNDTADTLSAAATNAVAFKVGPVKYRITGDVADRAPCVDSWNWENNITYDDRPCSGADLVDYSSVDFFEPVLTVDTEDVPQAIAGEAGPAILSLSAYLRKIGVSDATAEHIRISVTGGQLLPGNSRQLKFRVTGFSVNTAVAIT